MLSEQERQEMKTVAASAAIRREFERLKAASRFDPAQPMDLDKLMNFLTTMSRFSAQPSAPRQPRPYSRVLL